MNTKLTLNVDNDVIERAKEYARTQKTSLSKLIESYLTILVDKKERDIEITPLVRSLSGVIDLPSDYDYKKDYTDYLEDKYR